MALGHTTDWIIKGIVLVFLNCFTAFFPGWGWQQGYLLDDLDLKYGVFYVCGFGSTSLMDLEQECYPYDSGDIPLQFERITNWHMLASCGHCSSRRRATAAFQIIALILALVMAGAAVHLRSCRGLQRSAKDPFALLCVACGFSSMLAFAIWAEAMRRYNKSHLFAELGLYRSDPRLHYGVCFGLSICVFLLCILFLFVDFVEVFGRFVPKRNPSAPQNHRGHPSNAINILAESTGSELGLATHFATDLSADHAEKAALSRGGGGDESGAGRPYADSSAGGGADGGGAGGGGALVFADSASEAPPPSYGEVVVGEESDL